ncbi:MAG: hypothetical protein WCB00_24325 [Candidatus Acidiferrales bacterium]
MRIKLIIAMFALPLFASGAMGQVSCSPNVSKEMCVAVAEFMTPLLDHGVLHGVAIPMEIVTPAEYAKRLADMKEQEKRELDYAGGLDKAALHTDQFSPYYRHTLTNLWSEDTTFFRDKPSSPFVSAILVSSVEFEGVEAYTITEGAGKGTTGFRSNGRFEPKNVYSVGSFIMGYLCGTMGRMWDGGITADYIVNNRH